MSWLVPVFSDYIYEKHSVFNASGKKRAESLMDFYKDGEIRAIFDISGGMMARRSNAFVVNGKGRLKKEINKIEEIF